MAATPAEADARWLRHFSSIERGGPITPDDLVQRCVQRQCAFDLETFEVVQTDLPSKFDFEQAMRSAKLGRACGNDGFPADILHCHAGAMSAAFYPVLLKTAYRLQEPIQFKGGTVRQIWKQKGAQHVCTSFRGILISSTVGKAVHSSFRQRCGPWLDQCASPLQIGGRRGFPVQMAAHAAREYQSGFLRRGRCTAIVFLDLREAFHRVVRPLVHGGDLSDAHIAHVLQALHLPPARLDDLRVYVRETSLLESSGASEWASAMVREFQADSWLTIGQGLAVVEDGTRPGDALADVVFSFLFSAVLGRIREAIRDAGVEVCLPWHADWYRQLYGDGPPPCEHLAPVDVTWMDDLALLLTAPSPSAMLESVKIAASILVDECLCALLHPNLDRGKTEALVSLVGKGSQGVRGSLFRSDDPSIPLASRLWPSARLRLVPRYRHLGGILHWKGSLEPELKHRTAQAWAAFRKHRRLVFSSPAVTHREKALLFQSLVASTLFYGAGTWDCSQPSVVVKLRGTVLGMARQMLRPTYTFEESCHIGATKALAVARIPSVEALLHAERLRHLATVVRVAPAEFWAIMWHGQTWCRQVKASLDWLVNTLANVGRSHPQLAKWEDTREVMLSRPQQWKAWIRSAVQGALLEELWNAETQHFHGLLLRGFLAAGAVIDGDAAPVGPSVEICAPCAQRFSDLRCWSHHAFKRHGRVREVRRFLQGTQCPACLRHFASNFRLCNHVERSPSCLSQASRLHPSHDIEPGRGSRKFHSGNDVMLPAVDASGPKGVFERHQHVPEPMRPVEEVLTSLEDLFIQEPASWDYQGLLVEARRIFAGHCLQNSRLKATAKAWQTAVCDELASGTKFDPTWVNWHTRLAAFLVEVDFADWLVPDAAEPVKDCATFRDASLTLPWLSFASLVLPVGVVSDSHSLTFLASGLGVGDFSFSKRCQLIHFHECFCEPTVLDFAGWSKQRDSRVFAFFVGDLLSSIAFPGPVKNFRSLEPHLQRLRLFADLVRGILHLWTWGVSAVFVGESVSCPGLAAVRRAAPHVQVWNGRTTLSNFEGTQALLSRFTSSASN